jgi:hypothetical protein
MVDVTPVHLTTDQSLNSFRRLTKAILDAVNQITSQSNDTRLLQAKHKISVENAEKSTSKHGGENEEVNKAPCRERIAMMRCH